ncbi:MAG: glucose-6-phosphate isomerase [Oscillospiraceae bacterium]|nr:glucose-6-phosphate isomerase [Oscillospiraceae bacterium]
MIRIDASRAAGFLKAGDLERAAAAHRTLQEKTGAGSDFLGWVDLPVNYDRAEFVRIQSAAAKIQRQSQVLLVIGIGGSYLGARAVIELLRSDRYNLLPKETPEIYFAGNNLSSDSLSELITLVGDKDFSINIISKSGTTTEPAVAFRVFQRMIEQKYGREGARERIFATTDRAHGALKAMADKAGYETFVVPDDVGGRYSVLTAVGLLPIAVAGIDLEALMAGAARQREACLVPGGTNAALLYAMNRQGLYGLGKTTEILACFEPSFRFMAEWWKQLFGESEGKDGGGIFPASVDLTADLHSMGQYIQDGIRNLQETVVAFDHPRTGLTVPFVEGDPEGLNYLAGKSLPYINEKAMEATAQAHVDGGVPVTILHFDRMDETSCGEMIYFFEFACGISAYLSGVNPFNQPGVEAYKKNMFQLLGKPGY